MASVYLVSSFGYSRDVEGFPKLQK